ncbi:MAG: hypothetical protein ACREXS_06250 [Gammaproteobacteria bacterium]
MDFNKPEYASDREVPDLRIFRIKGVLEFSESHGSCARQVDQIATLVAELFNVHHCAIVLWKNITTALRRSSERPAALRDRGNLTMSCPMLINGIEVGMISVEGPKDTEGFTHSDFVLLEVVALTIAKSVRLIQAHNILRMHYAAGSISRQLAKPLSAGIHPRDLAPMAAQSFYGQLIKLGFLPGDIVHTISEVIAELNRDLRAHRHV